MTPHRPQNSRRRRLLIAVSLGLMLMLLTAVIAFAGIYTINTNDNTVAEWDNQGIPVFQTDPTGDTINGGGPKDDIIETRVATGDSGNTLYFLLKTDQGPAVDDINHSTAAYLDCDRDGVTGEASDWVVSYTPNYQLLIGTSERAVLCSGDEVNCLALGPDSGQQVGQYTEWSVPVSELTSCQTDVDIKFYTTIVQFGSQATVLDDTPLKGWNIPTAITLKEMQAQAAGMGMILPVLLAVGFAVLLGALAWLWRRRTA